jgi:hypothetical protein
VDYKIINALGVAVHLALGENQWRCSYLVCLHTVEFPKLSMSGGWPDLAGRVSLVSSAVKGSLYLFQKEKEKEKEKAFHVSMMGRRVGGATLVTRSQLGKFLCFFMGRATRTLECRQVRKIIHDYTSIYQLSTFIHNIIYNM